MFRLDFSEQNIGRICIYNIRKVDPSQLDILLIPVVVHWTIMLRNTQDDLGILKAVFESVVSA